LALWPLVIACAALVAIVAALDPAGDHPGGFDGPGLTVDEPFNIEQGVALVDRLFDGDWAGFRKIDARLPDHPPLGRVWIGLCHELAYIVWPPLATQAPYSAACARVAPALAFSLTVFLVGCTAGRWYGRFSGAAAAFALAIMPRMFGHAHLAALETCINLAYASVVLYLADRWISQPSLPTDTNAARPTRAGVERQAPSMPASIAAGVLLGLALLTKVQAILLPIPVALWALWLWRGRALAPLAIWGLVGLVVLFAGWPYLWAAPIDHFQKYLGRTTDRAVILVWYFGRALADREVPWHYPWVMFAATVPLGLHALGLWGVASARSPIRRSPRELLVLACLAFPLIVFSLPRVVVYDGERLFSVVFPLWAVMIGKGAGMAREWLSLRLPRVSATAVVCGFLACQSVGLFVTAPCWLSYYNLAVGGLRGAARLGLPTTYWGDSITRSLLREVAETVDARTLIAVAPVLTPAQWAEVTWQCPALQEREIQFDASGQDRPWRLVFDRKEYLPPDLRGPLDAEAQFAAVVRRNGVVLGGLYRSR
jgi:hypothetical protein